MAKALDVAFVEILPDTRKLEATADRDISKALKKAEKSVQATSEEISSDLSGAFRKASKDAEASLKGMSADIGKVRDDAKKSPVVVPLKVEGDIGGFTRDARGRLRDERDRFTAEGKSLGAATADGFGDGFRTGLSGALKGIPALVGAALTGPVTSAASSILAALVPVAGFFGAVLPTAIATTSIATKTLTLAFLGFDDIISNVDNPKKFEEALEKLSPTAQRVALTIRDVLVPAFQQIQFSVQNTTFNKVNEELIKLAGVATGPLKSGLSGIAQEFNTVILEVLKFLRSKDGIDLLNSVLQNTKSILSDFTPAILPVGRAFADLVNATQPFLQSLSGGIADAVKQFALFISQAAKSGELQKFLQQGLATLGDLGIIARNVGQILGVLFDSSSEKGRTLLTSFAELTGTLAKFLQSAEGSAAVKALLGFLQNSLGGVLDVVKPLLPLAGRMLELLGTEFSGVLQTLTNVLEPVAKALADGLLPIFPEMIKVAKEVTPLITELGRTVGKELGKALAELLPSFTELFLQLLPIALPVLRLLIGAFTFLAPALKFTVLPLKLLFEGVTLLIQGIKDLVKWIGSIDWAKIGKSIGDAFSKAWTAVKNFFTGVGTFFSELPGKVIEFVSSLPGKFVTFLNKMFDEAIKTIGRGIGLVLLFFIETPDLVVEAISSLAEKVPAFLDKLWSDIKTGVATAWTAVIEFFKGIPDKITTAISTVRTKVGDFISGSITFWKDTIVSGWNSIIEFIKSIPSKLAALRDFFFSAGRSIIFGFLDGLKNVGNFIGDVAGSIVRTIVSFLNRIIGKLNEGIAEVDEFLPGSLPRIPSIALAKGGLVTGPTNALIGEAGDEFVLPLQGSKAKRAAEALGISDGNGQTVTFENGAIQISFEGVVPTDQQARNTGESVARGINQTLARRNIRTQVRMA